MNQVLEISTGEAVLFWIVAPLMVILATGLLFSKKTIHIAVSVAGVMIGLATLYIANEAPFLGVVQIVVYTGAVMMLFLFVIMLVGVDATESLTERLKGQRTLAVIAGLGSIALFVAIFTRANLPVGIGLEQANADTNPVGVARIIFADYVFALELVAAILITAAVGALTLSHKVRLGPKQGQRETLEAKMASYHASGDSSDVTPKPNPGVYATTNAADVPSIDPYGKPIDSSISSILQIRAIGEISDDSPAEVTAEIETDDSERKEIEG